MFNRAYINELKARIEFLEKDIESKENTVCNLLEANKELSLSNNYLENKIKLLEQVIKHHEENECRLNQKVVKYKGMLDKIDNCTRMLEGREMNKSVTAEEFELGFNKFCDKNKGDYDKCKSSCKYYEVSRYNCDLLWILDNYNVTRKDNK